MPKGGRREGAGRKTAWESGCSFAETTVVRVPKYLKTQILELAHRLDAGEEIELVTNSIKDENQELRQKVAELEKELTEAKSYVQLQIPTQETAKDWNQFKNNILKTLKVGSQAKLYKRVKRALDQEIEKYQS